MLDKIAIAGSALMPLTSAISLTIHLSSSLRQGKIGLPVRRDEALSEKDPFDIQDEAVMRDGSPVDEESFWRRCAWLKWGLLATLIPPFGVNIALLVLSKGRDVAPTLLLPSHLITLFLLYRYFDRQAHWANTIHLAVGVFVQFATLSTFALLPEYPFPQPTDQIHALFEVSSLFARPASILRSILPVLHLPPLLILLSIRRGPPLHLPVSVIYPAKITDAIPADHPSLDSSVPNVTEEVQCTIPEWLLFGYATNVIRHGYYAETMDVWDLPIIGASLRALPQYLNIRRVYSREGREGYNLLWKTAKANKKYLLAQQLLAAMVAVAYYLPHFLLQKLLEYLQNDPTRSNAQWGWLLCFGLFMSNALVYVGSGIIWSISSTTLQGRVRLQLNTLLFSKTLRKKDISAIEQKATPSKAEEEDDEDEEGIASKSQIMTLFTVDVDRVTEFVFHAFALVDAPIEIAVATFYLLRLLGPSAAYGLLACILCIPINHFASKVVITAQDNLMKSRDQRTALMNEVLQGIRMLKFMAWERSFERKIKTIRDRELHWQARNYQIEVAFNIIWEITPVLVTVVAFLHYTLVAGHTLTPALGFTAVSVFGELQYALSALPETFINALQGFVSCKRIEKYLNFAEVDQRPRTAHGDIVLNDATFAWPRDDSDTSVGFTLSDLSLRFPKGQLSLICGRLGSGKSLLLNGLLGEADLVKGDVDCPRSRPDAMATCPAGKWVVPDMVAYVPQQAWLQNASIRDNIVFSSPFDQLRYDQVLEACSLLPDLAIMEDGDQTEIGEKGLNLSGGQKARVSLARAMYSRAGILLLDDVLSAVDAHTAHAIMKNCLTGDIVKDRTVLLVSHHTALVSPAASYIVALENGDVKFAGARSDFVECGLMDELDEKVPTSPVTEKPNQLPIKNKSVASLIDTETADNSETSSIAETLKEEPAKKVPRKLIEDEKRATGRIAWPVWKTYFTALGGPVWWSAFIFTQMVTMFLPVIDRWWLQYWTSSDPHNPAHSSTFYVVGYALITVGGSIIGSGTFAVVYYGSIQASRLLHSRMLQSVLFAKLRFHDTTSRGRLLNRFGKDIEGLDSKMADNFSKSLEYGLSVLATFASIAYIGGLPFLGAGFIILILYYQAGSIYSTTSRDMRRLDSVTRSPLYSLFGETVSGVAVYRAFGASTIALHDMIRLADTNILAFTWTWTVNRWLSARCNLLSSFLIGIIAVIVLLAPGINAGMAGFALAFANTISHNLLFVVRRFVQLEQSMVALERIKEYSGLPLEAPEFTEPRPSKAWPAQGAIKVEDLEIRYAPDLPNVLHGINFTVQPREKIGVVGSTGCGKSTLALSFFRFVEAHAGRILIDDVDISTVGLTDLRSRVTIIPQDPTILSGTLRSTLDVFDEYDDADIYAALRRVHLLDEMDGTEDGRNKNVFRDLNNPVSEGGDNFSSGEKQLICMARAILKRNKVLFMDEATASIDYETDELISKTIRKEFSDSTILTIAHRLHTIIDFDKVLVMDKGRIAEFASPAELLRDHKSRFYALCRATGKVEFHNLKALAAKAEKSRQL